MTGVSQQILQLPALHNFAMNELQMIVLILICMQSFRLFRFRNLLLYLFASPLLFETRNHLPYQLVLNYVLHLSCEHFFSLVSLGFSWLWLWKRGVRWGWLDLRGELWEILEILMRTEIGLGFGKSCLLRWFLRLRVIVSHFFPYLY